MVSVVDAQYDILKKPIGTNVWSGQVVQSLNSDAVTWALAKDLYSFKGPYWIIPISIIIGMVPTTIQWFIHKVIIFSRGILNFTEGMNDYLALAEDWPYNGQQCDSPYNLHGNRSHFIPSLPFTHEPLYKVHFHVIYRCQLLRCLRHHCWHYLPNMAEKISSWLV